MSGRSGNIIDFLRISTNWGRLEIGGQGGSDFLNIITPGSRVVGFGGGNNVHLHNLYVYLVWVNL